MVTVSVPNDPIFLKEAAKFLMNMVDLTQEQTNKAVGPGTPDIPAPPVIPIPETPMGVIPPAPTPTPAPMIPPTTAAAPTPTPAPVIPAPLGTPAPGELDAEGIPWDARIHNKVRSKKKDLTWKIRRNLDPVMVATVKAELLGSVTAVMEPITPDPASMTPPVTPGIVTPPVTPVTPEPAAAAGITYPELSQKIIRLINQGTITMTTVTGILLKYQMSNLPELAAKPDHIPVINQEIDALCQ